MRHLKGIETGKHLWRSKEIGQRGSDLEQRMGNCKEHSWLSESEEGNGAIDPGIHKSIDIRKE